MQITINNLTQLESLHAVYKIDVIAQGDNLWQLLYVGTAPLAAVLQLKQLKHVPFVMRALRSVDAICITMIETRETEADANAARDEYVRDWKPPGNDPENHMRDRKGGNRPVVRNDGIEYASVTEAARAIGSPPQSITNHLAGRYGYASVQGYTFKRIG